MQSTELEHAIRQTQSQIRAHVMNSFNFEENQVLLCKCDEVGSLDKNQDEISN